MSSPGRKHGVVPCNFCICRMLCIEHPPVHPSLNMSPTYYDQMAQLEYLEPFSNLYGGYILAQLAGVTCDLIREDHIEDSGLAADSLLLASSCHHMKPVTAGRLLAHAQRGGKAMMSYSWNECLTPLTDELFGIETQWFWQPGPATTLTIGEAELEIPPIPRLAARATSGEVLAEFSDGCPAVIASSVGAGKAVLVTFPLERLLLETDVTGDGYHAFLAAYRTCFDALGIEPQIDCDEGAVSIQTLTDEAGRRRLVILVNHQPKPCQAAVSVNGWTQVNVLDDGTARDDHHSEHTLTCNLGPNGYRLIELRK